MPFCPQCGIDNPATARYCDQCGAVLIPVPSTSAPPPGPAAPTVPGAPLVSGPVTCPQCGTAAIPGEAFCDNCGAPLSAPARPTASPPAPPYSPGLPPQPSYPAPQPSGSVPPPAPGAPPVIYQSPQPIPAPTPPPPPTLPGQPGPQPTQPIPVPVAPAAMPRAVLAPAHLVVVPAGVVLPLPNAPQAIVGRADPVSNFYPDVDLTPYGALEQGVGRRHMRLFVQGGQIMAEDLDSTNGTLLNGQKLIPRQPQPLRNGDQLQLGRLVLRFEEH